jgi:hypothetical protein
MSEFNKLSKQERIKLANDLNKGSMRQTAMLIWRYFECGFDCYFIRESLKYL